MCCKVTDANVIMNYVIIISLWKERGPYITNLESLTFTIGCFCAMFCWKWASDLRHENVKINLQLHVQQKQWWQATKNINQKSSLEQLWYYLKAKDFKHTCSRQKIFALDTVGDDRVVANLANCSWFTGQYMYDTLI